MEYIQFIIQFFMIISFLSPKFSQLIHVSRTPDWFTNVLSNTNYLLAASTGIDEDLQKATYKALQNAQKEIAKQIEVEIESVQESFIHMSGITESYYDFSSLTTATSPYEVTGARIIQKSHYKEGNKWRVFLLSAYPMISARELTAQSPVEKYNHTLSPKQEAFTEVERELEKLELLEQANKQPGENSNNKTLKSDDLKNQKNIKGDDTENIWDYYSDALKDLLTKSPYNKSYAIVIGINKYQNLKTEEWLKYAINDAKEMEKYLKDEAMFDVVISLYDQTATTHQIMKTIIGLENKFTKKNNTRTDDRLIIYFSGHGSIKGETGYIIPYDGSLDEPYLGGIAINYLIQLVKNVIPAKHILFIFDNCYSGIGFKEKGNNLRWARSLTEETSIRVLTAGSSNQKAIELDEYQRSLYTFHLLNGLRGKADIDNNQIITISELHSYVHGKVSSQALNSFNITQNPQINCIAGEGEIIFYKYFNK